MSMTASTSEAEVGEALRGAAAARQRLRVTGGGSRPGLAAMADEGVATLSTTGLNGVTLYEPGALTLAARAGTPLAEIEATLAAAGQMLPFEPIDHRRLYGTGAATPTIGGAVAVGASGPRRIRAGGCRDSLIGVRFVNGAGEVVKAGGRVMKNVTGYDLVKLQAGARGALGVLTEVTFKVLPAPEREATLALDGLDDARAVAAMAAALGSPFEVSGAAHLPAALAPEGVARTLLRLEGFAVSLADRAPRLAATLADFGRVRVLDAAASPWAALRDAAAFAADGPYGAAAIWRASVRPSDGPAVAAAAVQAGARAWFYDWAGGLVWIATPDAGDAGGGAIRSTVRRLGGSVALMRASAATRAAQAASALDPVRARLEAGLRAAFDPAGVLAPGAAVS